MKRINKGKCLRYVLSLVLIFSIVFTGTRFGTIETKAMSVSVGLVQTTDGFYEVNVYNINMHDICRLRLSTRLQNLNAGNYSYHDISFSWYDSNKRPVTEVYLNGSSSVILYLKASRSLNMMGNRDYYIERLIKEEQHNDKFTAQEPTCTKNGFRENRCAICGTLIHSQTIPALGHNSNNVWVIGANATCTANGEQHTNCTRCGANMNSTPIPALGHNSNNSWITTKNPTCTENGSKHTNCTRCNTNMNVTSIPALGHDMSNSTITTYPTVYKPGVRTGRCTRCSYENTSVEPQYHFTIYVGRSRIKKIAKGSQLLFEHTNQDASTLPFVAAY